MLKRSSFSQVKIEYKLTFLYHKVEREKENIFK